jgi:alcohol dehydrogenase
VNAVEPAVFDWRGTTVVVGAGALAGLERIGGGRSARARPVALFCGSGSMRSLGVLDAVRERLEPLGPIEVFQGIASNPGLAEIDAAAEFLRGVRPEVLVALGGGSVLDTAKVANCLAATSRRCEELLDGAPANGRIAECFAALPTTTGSGSEVTPFATVWDRDRGRKLSLDTLWALPTLAVLDPALPATMPSTIARQTAADALGHALESLWSRRSSPLSEGLAWESLRWLVAGIEALTMERSEAYAALQRGSLLAGMAISLTRTAAAHALSYAITLRHDVPHGLAVAELLPAVLRLNEAALRQDVQARLRDLFRSFGSAVPEALDAFLARHGMRGGLEAHGVRPQDVPALLATAPAPARLGNNLVALDAPAMETIYRQAMSAHA